MKMKFLRFKNVKSTNDEAIKLIKKNITKPTLISADKQTRGRGTMGKKWLSIKGNLFISIFFEINQKKINFKQLAVLNAYLIRKILKKYILKNIKIKWPNDLLIGRKKVCGILQEVIVNNDRQFLIVGIGINTLNAPKIKNFETTYLKKFSKKKIDNEKMLKDIKFTYEKFIYQINKNNFLNLKKKIK